MPPANTKTQRNKLMLIATLGAIGALAIITLTPNLQPKPTNYTNISPEELWNMMKEKDFILVNVHVPYEGEIPGTDLFIPYNEISANLDKLPGKDSKIVLYCMSGRMSSIAARTLVELGYTMVFNLEGGMLAWNEKGLPLINFPYS